MTLNHLSDSAAVTLRGLAAAAGVAELADGAAVDAAEGDDFLAGLTRHEIALGHQLVMALAAAGNGALDRAAAAPGAVPGAAPETGAGKADLAAGRFGGGVARLSGHLRQSVRLLQRQPAAADARWVGLHFADEPLCSPEEEARRLAAAKAAAAAADPNSASLSSRRRSASGAWRRRAASASAPASSGLAAAGKARATRTTWSARARAAVAMGVSAKMILDPLPPPCRGSSRRPAGAGGEGNITASSASLPDEPSRQGAPRAVVRLGAWRETRWVRRL